MKYQTNPLIQSFYRSFVDGSDTPLSETTELNALKTRLPWGVNAGMNEVRFRIAGESKSFALLDELRRHLRDRPAVETVVETAKNPAPEPAKVSPEVLKEIARVMFCFGRKHRRDPRFSSVSSASVRSFYRQIKKKYPSLPAEKAFFDLFWERDSAYSRTEHYTKKAKWRMKDTFSAPEVLSSEDLPKVPEDRSAVIGLLCDHYNDLPARKRGFFFASLYTLCLGLADPSKDYLTALRLFFLNDEVWKETTQSFWNTGTSSVLLNNKQTRKVLYNSLVVGYDISNCHPTLLHFELTQKGIETEYLSQYISNRNSIMNSLIENDRTGSPLLAKPLKQPFQENEIKEAKQKVLATMFGQRVSSADHPFIQGLKTEIKGITDQHYEGSARKLSHAMYRHLGRIQQLAKQYFGDDLIGTVIDCFYVRKESKKTIEEFQEMVRDLLGYKLNFGDKE